MKQKNILKLTAATLAIIGAGTILFHSAAEVVLAMNEGKVETVPTSYQVWDSPEKVSPLYAEKEEEQEKKEVQEEQSEQGKANYTVSMDSLNTGTPTDTDLTMEEAAEVGAGYLKKIYGLDLDGAYVYMSYDPGTETFPRPFWSADVLFEKEQTPESTRWGYMIDAVTGELFDVSSNRKLDVSVSLGYDAALEKDCGVYAELARKKAEEWKLMDSPVDRVEYSGQGYSVNDPSIEVNVIGGNGEIVNMSFSRYDQTFLGCITDTSRKVSESALSHLGGESQALDGGNG